MFTDRDASRSWQHVLGVLSPWQDRAARERDCGRLQDDGERHFRDGAFLKAALCFHVAAFRHRLRPSSYCTLALIYLRYGYEEGATRWLRRAAAGDTHYWGSDYDVARIDAPNATAATARYLFRRRRAVVRRL